MGYQRSETSSQVQRDALGQRVRERFNEETDFKSIPQPSKAELKLNNKNLKKEEKSITTPSQLSSAFRKLGTKPTVSVQAATKKDLSRKQPSRASRTIFSQKSLHKSAVSLTKPAEEAEVPAPEKVEEETPYATTPADAEKKDLPEEPV